MKKLLLTAITAFMLIACSKNDNNNNNEYLPDDHFDTGTAINTNFPQYNSLKHPGNHIVINNFGINGIVLSNYTGAIVAFELSDPNHHFQSCSGLTLDGVIAVCNCEDGNEYHIITGQPNQGTSGQYGLKPYFVEENGNIIRVYNN